MKILILDRSVPFTGHSLTNQPLGAAQRALCGLARALAVRDHGVSVATTTTIPAQVDGVNWFSIDKLSGSVAPDLVIAWQDPSLLDLVPDVPRRAAYFLSNDLSALEENPALKLALMNKPSTLLLPDIHQMGRVPELLGVTPALLSPGADPRCFAADGSAKSNPAVAITTCHPAQGLAELVELWIEEISQAAPLAELHLYSAVLEQELTGNGTGAFEDLVARLRTADAASIRVCQPMPLPDMIDAYSSARVYLQPRQEGVLGLAMVEAAASSLPVIALKTELAEARVAHGIGGMVAPDDEAFINLSASLLKGHTMFANYAGGARANARRWEDAAAELETLW